MPDSLNMKKSYILLFNKMSSVTKFTLLGFFVVHKDLLVNPYMLF